MRRAIAAGISMPILLSGILASSAAEAAGAPTVVTAELMKQLVGLFVVATLMESALSSIFNWRLYKEFFNGRAMKTLVMIAFGYAVVTIFSYDIFYNIINAAAGVGESGPLSRALSALVLAGGSAAVYQLFRSLGLRPPVEPEEDKPQPSADKAWVSVRIIRKHALGDVVVHIDTVANPTDEIKNRPAIAGVIGEKKALRERLRRVFFADTARLPMYGGHKIDAGDKVYRIAVSGTRWDDDPAEPTAFIEDIYVGRFAGRSIVDFVHTV